MALIKQTYTDDGKKSTEKPKTQTVSVGGREVSVPTSSKPTTPTTKQTVTVSGREIKVDVPQTKAVASKPATNNTVPKADAAKPVSSTQAKADTYVSGRKINTNDRQQIAAAQDAIAEKKAAEANEIISKGNDARNARIAENPNYEYDLYQFRNKDGVISGAEYKQKRDELDNSYNDLYNSFDKLESDYYKDKNYAKYEQGFNELVNIANQLNLDADFLNSYSVEYNETAVGEYESNKQRMMELVKESAYLKKNGGYLGQKERIDAEYNALKARNEELQTLVDDIDSLKYSDKHDWLLSGGGNEKEIRDFESYVAASDDSMVARRARTLASKWAEIPYAVLSTTDIAFDLLGDAAGYAMESVANNLNENGYISDEDFNKISDVAKSLEAFEFDNENNYSQQLREYRAKIQNERKAGNLSPLEDISGDVIDSALENYARYNILNKYGTVLMALSTFGDSYKEARDRGFSPVVSALGAGAKGYITWWSENLKTENYFKVLGSTAGSKIDSQFFSILGEQLIRMVPEEGIEELAEGALDAAVDWLSYELQPIDAEGNQIEAPEFKPGDLMKNAMIAMASTALSATVGAVKGSIYYNNVVPTINSTEEYLQFKAEQSNLKDIVSTEADIDRKIQLQTYINMTQRRIDEFEKKSPTAGKIELATDNVIKPTIQQATVTYKQAISPTVTAMSDEQEKTDSEILTANEYLKQIAQTTLREKGIVMPYKEYLNLPNNKREEVNKISETFNNLKDNKVILAFSTNAPKGGRLDMNVGGTAIITVNPNSETMIQDIFKHEILHLVKNSPVWQELVQRTDSTLGKTKETKKQILRNANYSEDVLEEELVAFMNQNEYNLQTFLNTIGKSDANLLIRLQNTINDYISRLGKQSDADMLARRIGEAFRQVMSNPSLTPQKAMANNDIAEIEHFTDDYNALSKEEWYKIYNSKKKQGVLIFAQNNGTYKIVNVQKDGSGKPRRLAGVYLADNKEALKTVKNTFDIISKLAEGGDYAKERVYYENGRALETMYADGKIRKYSYENGLFNFTNEDPRRNGVLAGEGGGRTQEQRNSIGSNDNKEIRRNADINLEITPTVDDQGRELSPGQRRFFANESPLFKTKNGSLMTFFHSTPNEFNTFDKKKIGENTFASNTGYGFFFTPSREFSERFRDINNEGESDEERRSRIISGMSNKDKAKNIPGWADLNSEINRLMRRNTTDAVQRRIDGLFEDRERLEQEYAENMPVPENGYTMEVYLRSKNPIIHPYMAYGIDDFTGEELDQIVIDYLNAIDAEDFIDELRSSMEENEIEDSPGALYWEFQDMVQFEDVFENAKEERKLLQKKGYDALILYEGNEERVVGIEGSDEPVVSYIVFEPNQIKRVDNLDPSENNDDTRYNADINPNGLQAKLSSLPGVEFDEETQNMLDQVEESIVFTGGVTDQMLGALEQRLYDSRAYYEEGFSDITKKDINRWLRNNPLKWSTVKGDNRDNLIDFQRNHPGFRFAKDGGRDWDVIAMQFEEDFPGAINANELNTAVDFINAVQDFRDSIDEANQQQRVDPGDYEEFSKQFDQIIADFIKANEPKITPKTISQSTLDAIERNRQAFRDSVKSWVQNYDVIREKYDIFDQQAFDDAIADVYVIGQIQDETKEKLKESIIKNDFEGSLTGTRADEYIESFVDEAVNYYILENEYNVDKRYRDKIARSANVINQASDRMYEEDYDRSEDAIAIDKMAESYKKRDYNAITEIVQRLVENIQNKKNIFYNRDLKEYHDVLANGDIVTRNDLFELVEEPVRNAQAEEIKTLQEFKTQIENLQKETGIKMYSEEDEAIGWVIEGKKQDGEGYSVGDLKKDFPEKWQDIMKVVDYYRETVEKWYKDEIDLSEKIYGDVLHENELKTAKLENQLEAARQILFKRQQDLKKNPSEKTQAGFSKAKKSFETAERKYNAQIKKNEEHIGTRRQYTPYRQNYFHHTDEVRFAKNAKAFFEMLKNGKQRSNNIPTELAGMTEYTEPRSTAQSYRWKQSQKNYSSSGFASLSHRLTEHANAMAFDPTVSYLRTVESTFRELDSDNNANNYVTWLTKYINNMAGKSSDLDRVIRDMTPNEAMAVIKTLNERAKKNAVYGNISSSLVQVGNLPVGIGLAVKNGGKEALQDLVKGTAQYYLDSKAGVGIKDSSTFLNMRYFNIDLQDARFSSNINKFGDFMITALDKVSTEQMWYMFYEQGMRLKKENPILYADQMTDRSVQGRRPEDMPLSQQSEIIKLIVPFQVEVNNQWQVMKDMAKGSVKGENKAANIAGLTALMITSAIMSYGFRKILNRDPLFNPIGALVEALSDPEMTEEKVAGRVIGEVLGAIPGGQYIPSLMGLSEDEAEELFGDSDPSRYGTGNIGLSALVKLLTAKTVEERQKALEEVIFTYGPSGFGKQGLRFYRAGQDFGYAPKYVNGEWRMDPIHYTSSGGVAFANDPKDFFDFLGSAIGGQYNTKAAREYVESDFKKMGENGVADPSGEIIKGSKAIMVRKEMEDLGIFDDVLKQIKSGKMTAQKAGLSWKVVNMSPEEFQQEYNNLMSQAAGIHSEISKAFKWDEDKTNSLKDAIDIEPDYNESGKKVTDSEALKTRMAMEEAGIYDEVVQYINENNLDPTTVGLGKRVINYDNDKFLEVYTKKIKGE